MPAGPAPDKRMGADPRFPSPRDYIRSVTDTVMSHHRVPLTRRDFVRGSSAALGALAMAPVNLAGIEADPGAGQRPEHQKGWGG